MGAGASAQPALAPLTADFERLAAHVAEEAAAAEEASSAGPIDLPRFRALFLAATTATDRLIGAQPWEMASEALCREAFRLVDTNRK